MALRLPPRRLRAVFDRLLERYGPQHWWPGDSPFEVMIGAVLTQNTSWTNVEKAMARLREEDLLDPGRLYGFPVSQLSILVRSSGYYNQKARRLKDLAAFVMERYGGDIRRMRGVPVKKLRPELLGVKGIGPETADSILLYALDLPVFVGDAYTRRMLFRHRWLEEGAGYDRMVQVLTRRLPPDPELYNEYHALVVELGKRHCRTRPQCSGCPLQKLLPRGGAHMEA